MTDAGPSGNPKDAGAPNDPGDGGSRPGGLPGPTQIQTEKQTKIQLPPPHDDFSDRIDKRFADMDRDKDGFISKDDLGVALQSTKFTKEDAAMVATLWVVFSDFEDLAADEVGWENDGVTRADVTAYDRLRLKDPKADFVVKVTAWFNFAKSKIASASANLFDGDPDPMGIRQGMVGDCWMLSALVGLILRDKTAVGKMITAEPGGDKFKVKFPGAGKEITVTKPTDGELAVFAVSNGLWLPILEKSYGAATNRDALFFVESSDVQAVDGGNFLGVGITLMTGNSNDGDRLSFTFEPTTRDKLKTAFAKKKVVTAGVDSALLGEDKRANGLPMGHAYTVLSFDPKTDIITLRNPWGNAGTKFGAVFNFTIPEFDDNFSDIAYEE